jgi:arabinose-5-phosphate isomerase
MRSHELPCVAAGANAGAVVAQITRGGLGISLVVDGEPTAAEWTEAELLGIITDGDLRRALEAHEAQFFSKQASELMTPHPVTVSAESTMQSAIELMDEHRITLLVVVDAGRVIGVVQK